MPQTARVSLSNSATWNEIRHVRYIRPRCNPSGKNMPMLTARGLTAIVVVVGDAGPSSPYANNTVPRSDAVNEHERPDENRLSDTRMTTCRRSPVVFEVLGEYPSTRPSCWNFANDPGVSCGGNVECGCTA